MLPNNRTEMRQFFFDTWQKAQQNQPLEALEQLVTTIIQQHPEYHRAISNPSNTLQKEYFQQTGESNPFLHMGLHISLQEQVGTNRPKGVTALYQKLLGKFGDEHRVAHAMMECLAKSLHQAQQDGGAPDERGYVKCLRKIKGI